MGLSLASAVWGHLGMGPGRPRSWKPEFGLTGTGWGEVSAEPGRGELRAENLSRAGGSAGGSAGGCQDSKGSGEVGGGEEGEEKEGAEGAITAGGNGHSFFLGTAR